MTPLVLTHERATSLWEALSQHADLRAQLAMRTPEEFWAQLTARQNVFYDAPQCMVALLDVRPMIDATLVVAAFDRQLKDKEPLVREAVAEAFDLFRLRRLTAYTPADNPPYLKFLARLGFVWEGVLRQGWDGLEGPLDLHINGLLRGEMKG